MNYKIIFTDDTTCVLALRSYSALGNTRILNKLTTNLNSVGWSSRNVLVAAKSVQKLGMWQHTCMQTLNSSYTKMTIFMPDLVWQKSMMHMPVGFICFHFNSLHRFIGYILPQINIPSPLLAWNSSTISLLAAVGERMSQPWCPGTSACWCSRTEELQPQLQWWVQWYYQLQCQQQ